MIERREGESQLDFHRRLIKGKLVDKTLADVDYAELAEPVYGENWSSESTRKAMYGSLRTLQLIDRETEEHMAMEDDGDHYLKEIAVQKQELEKERQRFYDQRREYKKLIRNDGRYAYMLDYIAKAAERVADQNRNEFAELEKPVARSNEYSGEAVLVLNDWHYGMICNNIYNCYDTDICVERLQEITAKAIEAMTLHKPKALNVLLLGDAVHGAIHTSARVASEELVADQLMQVAELIAQCIETLAQYVPEIRVYATYGNHARVVANKDDSIHRDNFERLIPWWLHHRLYRTDNVYVQPERDDEFIYFEADGVNIVATHGDLDKIENVPRLFPALFPKVDLVIMGDKHHAEEVEELGVTAIIADALCGSDDYANGKRLYSSPGQVMIFMKDGEIGAQYRLRCDRRR